MAGTFVARAERLLEWLDAACLQIRGERFADIDGSGFELAQTLLRGRLIPQARSHLAGPTVIAFWGGTNTGKSTLINSLVRGIASPAGGTAGFTRRLVGAGSPDTWKRLLEAYPGWRLAPYDRVAATRADERVIHLQPLPTEAQPAPVAGTLLLLDTPDLDSANPECRQQACFALELADIAVWVTTAQKYKDQSGIGFLDRTMTLILSRIDLFNQSLPRHGEAIEDLRREYDRRWPANERMFLAIEETTAEQEGLLPPALVQPLADRLGGVAGDIRNLRARGGVHALRQTGARLLTSAAELRERRQTVENLGRQLRQRIDEGLLQHLRALPGHEVPFELQAALVRVIGQRLQTRVGDLLNKMVGTATDTLGSVYSRIFGSRSTPPTDPVEQRDLKDLADARLFLEKTRQGLLAWLRKKAGGNRHGFHGRFHEAVKRLPLPDGATLTEELERHLRQRSQELLLPLIERFENDLERFCEENPQWVNALKVAVPGVSTAASIAAAAVSIKTLTILPGVSEYLLAGVAIPIYRRLEGHLPAQLLQLCTSISRRPFIQEARDEFTRTRRRIFLETGDWLLRPVEELLQVPELPGIDLQNTLTELEQEWNRLCQAPSR